MEGTTPGANWHFRDARPSYSTRNPPRPSPPFFEIATMTRGQHASRSDRSRFPLLSRHERACELNAATRLWARDPTLDADPRLGPYVFGTDDALCKDV